jgi:hypothetical protein
MMREQAVAEAEAAAESGDGSQSDGSQEDY